MEYHYRFLDDAVETFLESFRTYEDLRHLGENEADLRHFPSICQCIRSLYVSLEKGFKHGLILRDPYLPVSLPKTEPLIGAIREKVVKQLPTIYCGNAHMETVDPLAAWELLNRVETQNRNDLIEASFRSAIKRLKEARNHAQHGEFYIDPSELIATIEQVFLHFYEACGTLIPDWIELMCKREPQLESRLRSVRERVDGSWQVAVDYLRRRGPLTHRCKCWIASTSEPGLVDFVFGPSENSIGISGGGLASAEGLFAQYLTDAQVEMRREQRRSAQRTNNEENDGTSHAINTEHIANQLLTSWIARQASNSPITDSKQEPLIPLQSGRVSVAGAPARLRLLVPAILFVYSRVRNLVVDFPQREQSAGTLRGILESALPTGDNAPCIQLAGDFELTSEFESLPKEDEHQRTIWGLVGNVTLSTLQL